MFYISSVWKKLLRVGNHKRSALMGIPAFRDSAEHEVCKANGELYVSFFFFFCN